MYANSSGLVVENADEYTSSTGIRYPRNYPKSEISELTLVTEIARPTDPTLVVTGFTVDGSYNQVWTTRAKTSGELATDLANAKLAKILELYTQNDALKKADISFTTLGLVTKDFQTDDRSKEAIHDMLETYITVTPTGFYWRSSDNTNVTPFTRADLVALANAIGDRGWGYFQNIIAKKDSVMAQTTVSAVNAVVW